jgi:hypothetical protein
LSSEGMGGDIEGVTQCIVCHHIYEVLSLLLELG